MKLGIVAAGGPLPIKLIEHSVAHHIDFRVFPVVGHAAREAYQYPHDIFRLGAGGTFIRNLRRHGVTDVVIIGHLKRPTIRQLRPDLLTLFRILPKLGLASRGDNGVLSALANAIETYGQVKIRGIHEIMPDLLAPFGIMGSHQSNETLQKAIRIGTDAALELGRADIGQAVIAGPERIYAQEDRRGTDALLNDFATDPKADAVLVKLCKPQQDLRLDMPAIGLKTVEQAAAAGIKGIVVSARKTLVNDMEQAISVANSNGIFLQGIETP